MDGARCGCGAGRTGLGRWLAAWLLDRGEGLSDKVYASRKRALLGVLAGDVLEIGPGPGANVKYFGPGVRWIGVEPNVYMRSRLLKKVARYGLQADFHIGTAEQLAVPDSSVDAVVATLVLCSVDDVAASLREVLRVLRPGGRFVFIEHVAAPRGTVLRRLQDAIAPAWRAVADGCHCNRETGASLEAAGFGSVEYEQFRISTPMLHLSPHIAGAAVK